MEYVFDFGDSLISQIELIDIHEEHAELTYPRVVAKNKPRKIYCERCKLEGKKQLAKYNVYYFEGDSVEQLCETCVQSIEEDTDVSEIDCD